MSGFMKEGNIAALIIAIAAAILFIQWDKTKEATAFVEAQRQEKLVEAERAATPAHDWFVVRNVNVPDFIEGADPLMVYDREVIKPFNGTWNVDIRQVSGGTQFNICTGSGVSSYKPSEKLPAAGVLLSYFIGKKCDLPPGTYIMEATWELRPPGYPTKETSFTSNQFQVLPSGSQKYITPEQIERLEAQ